MLGRDRVLPARVCLYYPGDLQKMVIRVALALALVPALIAACGETSSDEAQQGSGGAGGAGATGTGTGGTAAADGGNSSGGTGAQGFGGYLGLPDGGGFPYQDAVASDGWCAPPDAGKSVTACCNDEPCQGLCYANDDGGVQCECFGIIGGCPEGSVCCWPLLGCKAPHLCYPAGGP